MFHSSPIQAAGLSHRLRLTQDDHTAPDPISQFGRSHIRGTPRHRQKSWSEA